MTTSSPSRMQCMEVWGNNQLLNSSVETPGLQIWAYCRPEGDSESGGDVCYLSSCASGRITRLLLADVSGHGEAVSQIAQRLREIMRSHVNYIKQTRLVKRVDEEFDRVTAVGGFATAVALTFFAPTRSLTVCNAGHPPPLIYRAAEEAWSVYAPRGADGEPVANLPLGLGVARQFQQAESHMEVGDMLLCYSDAITESRDTAGAMLGTAGLQRLLDEMVAVPPQELVRELLRRVHERAPESAFQDDTSLILLRATGESAGVKDTALAPFRMLSSLFRRIDASSQPGPAATSSGRS